MKILFLDMDGVLNGQHDKQFMEEFKKTHSRYEYENKFWGIDPDLVKYLKMIIDQTGCKIVFSTSWRYFDDHPNVGPDWKQTLADLLGMTKELFIGRTPDLVECEQWTAASDWKRRRGNEIYFWLKLNTEPGKYTFCVIDDEVSDILGVINPHNVVHTDCKTGLQMKDVTRAVQILNNER